MQKHEKDYTKIRIHNVPHKLKKNHNYNLKLRIQSDKKHPYANLKKTLEKKHSIFWTKKEEDIFVEMVKKHG